MDFEDEQFGGYSTTQFDSLMKDSWFLDLIDRKCDGHGADSSLSFFSPIGFWAPQLFHPTNVASSTL